MYNVSIILANHSIEINISSQTDLFASIRLANLVTKHEGIFQGAKIIFSKKNNLFSFLSEFSLLA